MTTSKMTRAAMATMATSALVLLAGCNAGSSSTDEPTTPAPDGQTDATDDGEQTDGGDGQGQAGPSDETIRIALAAEPASLDFTTTDGAAIPQLLLDNVYETLVTVDVESGEIVPSLATDWQVSEDGLTYTFTLAEGVTFSNGAELTAEDVVFSLERVTSDAWTVSLKSQLDAMTGAEATDEHTVEVTLEHPSNQFLYALTTRVGAIFDTEGTDDLANDPIGTGPYVFSSWDRGSKIVLERNEDYHGDLPYFAAVEMHYFANDPNAMNNAMLTGTVDVVSTVQAPEALSSFEGEDFQIVEGTTNGEVVLSFNHRHAPFDDLRVRQAARHAIDHEMLRDTCWSGYGELIGSMVPVTDPWYVDHTGDYPFDPARASELLDEADAQGAQVRLRVPTLPYAVACGTVVESMMEEAGFDVTVDQLEFPAAWLQTVFTDHDFEMSIVAHVEPRDMGNVFGGPQYYLGYDSAELQTLLEEADTGSPEEQVEKMKQAAALISEDAAADFLFLLPNLMVATPDITGLPTNAIKESFVLSALARN